MRVLVCSDGIGALTSAQAGRALATGWAGHATAVVPVGEAGGGFLTAVADTVGSGLVSGAIDGRLLSLVAAGSVLAVGSPGPGVGDGPIPYAGSSAPLGRALAHLLRTEQPTTGSTVFVDLVSDDVHDAGAGFLGALGAVADVPLDRGVAGLTGLSRLELDAARTKLAGIDLIGVVPASQRDRQLLGLRGITSVRGRANDEDPGVLLGTDADLARLAESAAPGEATAPGAGACGGTGFAVLALGGTLATGPELALAGVTGPVDLVVSGCGVFDFATRGGGVVSAAADLASRLLCPCIVVAAEVLIGGREMRTMGIEAAYAVTSSTSDHPAGGDVSADVLAAAAARVARSWRW